MNRYFPLLLVLLLGLACNAYAAAASDVGKAELDFLTTLITGNMGYALALVVCAIGIYNFAMGDVKGGVLLVVLGVLITLTPMFFNSMRSLLCPMVEAMSSNIAHCGSK